MEKFKVRLQAFISILTVVFLSSNNLFGNDKGPSKYFEIKALEFTNNLLYEETFENGEAWTGDSKPFQQLSEEHSFEITSTPVFRGNFSGKFELRYGDEKATENGLRAEVLFPRQKHNERWYSFSVYFPSNGYKDDRDTELFTQWHNGSGTPTTSFRVNNGKIHFRIGYDKEIRTAQWDHYDFGPVPKDVWTEFVFHFIHSYGDDGLVEIWRDGEKILTHKGPNIYEDNVIPRWKIGIYKPTWASNQTETDLRIVYYDNVRLGNENATLEDMRSMDFSPLSTISVTGISITPTSSTMEVGKEMQLSSTTSPSNATNKKVIWTSSNTTIANVNASGLVTAIQVGSATITAKTEDGGFTAKTDITVKENNNSYAVENFTLINAGSNTPIAPLSDGDELKFEDVEHISLNFRANTNPGEVGSVYFSLEGPVKSSRIDNGFTYDLLNNAGLILPIGNYRLTAIPYTERNGGGTKGTEASIVFSIVESEKTIVPDQPTLVSPIDNSKDLSNSLEFQWMEVENADAYSIQLSEKSDFNTVFFNQNGLETTQIQIKDLKSGTQYYWRVRASNEAGNSTWSSIWSITTKAVIFPPTAPILLGPENSSRELTGTISLKWAKPEHAEVYRIQIAKDTEFTKMQFDLYNIPTESFDINNLEAGITFYWRVSASNNGGSSGFSEIWKFETLKGPDVPKLISPSDGQSDMNTTVNLAWGNVPGADSYRLQVSTNRDFSQKIVDMANLRESQFNLEKLEEGKTYFWRVRATNSAGNSSYSTTWSFSTKISLLAPPTPQLISPESGALENSAKIELLWSTVERAEKYEVQVSTFSNFSQGITYQNNNLTSNKVVVDLDPDKIYFWRVRAVNAAGSSPYSQVWSLITQSLTPLDPPILLSPKNGAVVKDDKIDLVWGAVVDAKAYKLEISTEASFGNIVVSQSNLQETYASIANLKIGSTYYWRIIASGDRHSSQSEIWSFTISEVNMALAEILEINVFPNPFREFINVAFSRLIEEDVFIVLLDNKGQIVMERQFKAPGTGIYLPIPQGLANGPYNLRIQSSRFVETRKIIKR